MRRAIELAVENVKAGRGGPFGALVVKANQVIATGVNLVTSTNDPTAHAEVVAIRNACEALKVFQLDDCEIYTSCEPCPMCLGAIYWARPNAFYYAYSRHEAAQAGFDDEYLYAQIALAPEYRSIPGRRLLPTNSQDPFEEWAISLKKVLY